jgi:hypothetical protein
MIDEQPLRAALAARRLGNPSIELPPLLCETKIRYVRMEGIAHIPIDAMEKYRSRAS